MECPFCDDARLLKADRNGIAIDYCPQCRGIWLDRGELDKIVERSRQETPTNETTTTSREQTEETKKRKRNLITELFDF
ncbi:zf-TFIIB domain-containing protein [Microbulbifer halophilus]|uniref:Zf-TFIIB domain-containing protein n=1 Tax=Microbulbifer halophilus TaxID=453963 RepID=A0ABW5E9W2_9GAMM|nr:zf-TFIIB domain-containing protein [Microbulbifer halophilus]MCW8126496.1 zf-TFIIB domain-containing protein [Microbulbifer halophilus]